jgi:undecaprenyl-diphosphatase
MHWSKKWRHYAALQEFRILVVLGIVLVGIWGFIELAEMVNEGDTRQVDTALLMALRSPADPGQAIGPPWLEEIMRDITALGGTAFLALLSLGVIGYLILLRRYGLAVLVLVSVGGAMLLNYLLKLGFDRPRPDLVPHLTVAYQTSFPSGHSMSSAATYLTLGAMMARVQAHRRLKIYFLSLAIFVMLLVGFSRVYLGVHWPTDVLAGWAAGAIWALLCWAVAWWLTIGRTNRQPPDEVEQVNQLDGARNVEPQA